MDPESLKVPELKAELQRRGLDTQGLKADLLLRLKTAIANEGNGGVQSDPASVEGIGNDNGNDNGDDNGDHAGLMGDDNGNHAVSMGADNGDSADTNNHHGDQNDGGDMEDNGGEQYESQPYDQDQPYRAESDQDYEHAESNGGHLHEQMGGDGGVKSDYMDNAEYGGPGEYHPHAENMENPSSQDSSEYMTAERIDRHRSESPDASRSPRGNNHRERERDRDRDRDRSSDRSNDREDSRGRDREHGHRRSEHRRSRDDDDESVSSREPDEKRRRLGGNTALDLSSNSTGPFVADPDGWWITTTVQLDRFFSDLNLVLDSDGYRAKTLNDDGFGMMMGGVKATYGVPITATSDAKVAFEVRVIRLITPSSIHPDEKPRHVLRIGFSTPEVSPNRLADDKTSFAFDCRGRIIKSSGESKEFGSKCTETDVITVLLDLSSPEFIYVDIMRNGDRMPISSSSNHSSQSSNPPPAPAPDTAPAAEPSATGDETVSEGASEAKEPSSSSAEAAPAGETAQSPPQPPPPPPPVVHAFTYNRSELLSGDVSSLTFIPHILLKNVSVECNFGQKPASFALPPGFVMINELPVEQRIRNPMPPTSKSECEVIMMCGLPSAGKTFWVNKLLHEKAEMRFNALGVSYVLDAMRLDDKPRRRVHKEDQRGKTCDLIDTAMRCLNKLIEAAANRPRNYILDQTNVYATTQRRKMTLFAGFKRRAVVVVPSDDEYKRRIQERERIEGRDIPYDAILEMRAGFELPSTSGGYLDAVEYVELNEEESRELVKKYNDDGAKELAKAHERDEELAASRGDYHRGRGGYDSGREYRRPFDRFSDRRGERFGGRGGGGGGGYDRDRGDRRDYERDRGGERRRFRNSDEPEHYRETEYDRYRARGPPPPPPRFAGGYDSQYGDGGPPGGGYRGRGFRGGPRGGGGGGFPSHRGGGDGHFGGRGRGRDGQGLLPPPVGGQRGGWNGAAGGGHWEGGRGGRDDGYNDNRNHRGEQPPPGPGPMRGGMSGGWGQQPPPPQRGPPPPQQGGGYQQQQPVQPSGYGGGAGGYRPPPAGNGDRPPRQSRWSENPSTGTVPPVASSTQPQHQHPASRPPQQSGQYAPPVGSSYQGSYQQPQPHQQGSAPQYGGYQPPSSGSYSHQQHQPPSQPHGQSQQHQPPSQQQSGQQSQPQQQWNQWNQQQQQQQQQPQWSQQQYQQQQRPQGPQSGGAGSAPQPAQPSSAQSGQSSQPPSWSSGGYNYPGQSGGGSGAGSQPPPSSASAQPPPSSSAQAAAASSTPNQQGWTAAQQQWWQQYGAQWQQHQQQMAQAAQAQTGGQGSSGGQSASSQPSASAPPAQPQSTASMTPQQQQAYQQQWQQWQQYYSQYAAATAAAGGSGGSSAASGAQQPSAGGASTGSSTQPPSTANPWPGYSAPQTQQSSYGSR